MTCQCGQVLFVSEINAGKKVRCKRCRATQQVPASPEDVPDDGTATYFPPRTEKERRLLRAKSVDIVLQDGTSHEALSFEELRKFILDGEAKRADKARVRAKGAEEPTDWETVETVTAQDPSTQWLYSPIWRHSLLGYFVGAAAGAIINGASSLIGVVPASVQIVTRDRFSSLASAPAFFLGALLTACLVGGAFGVLVGGIVGTCVGHKRSRKLTLAPDAPPEGNSPWIKGVVIPLVLLIALGRLYLLLLAKFST